MGCLEPAIQFHDFTQRHDDTQILQNQMMEWHHNAYTKKSSRTAFFVNAMCNLRGNMHVVWDVCVCVRECVQGLIVCVHWDWGERLARIANVGGNGLGEDKGSYTFEPNVSSHQGNAKRSSPTQEHVKSIFAKLPSKFCNHYHDHKNSKWWRCTITWSILYVEMMMMMMLRIHWATMKTSWPDKVGLAQK